MPVTAVTKNGSPIRSRPARRSAPRARPVEESGQDPVDVRIKVLVHEAPAIEDMRLLDAAPVALADADGAGKRPVAALEARKREPRPHRMQRGRLLADADAAASAELEAEAGALRVLEAEPFRAEPVLAHQPLERALGVDAAAEHAVARAGIVERIEQLDRRQRHRAVLAQRDRPELGGVAKLAIEPGLLRLDEPGLGHQRAELAGGLDPLDAAQERRELPLELRLRIGEVRHHAVREILRLADVEQRVVLAVEEIDAGALRDLVRERRDRAAAAGATSRAAASRARRAPPPASARARSGGNPRAPSHRRAHGDARRSRCRGAASPHRDCARARRA